MTNPVQSSGRMKLGILGLEQRVGKSAVSIRSVPPVRT